MTSTVSHVLIGIIVPLVFVLLARLIPYQPPPDIPKEELDALAKRYRWVSILMLPPLFVFTGILTWAWAAILNDVAEWRLSVQPPSVFLLKPEWTSWMLPGLFLGIISSGLPGDALLRLILGPSRYAEYMTASQLRYGFDARKAMIGLVGVVVILAGGWTILALDWSTRFEEEQIAVNPLLSFGETIYGYGDVDQLVEATHFKAPNGNIVQRTCWYIIFRDGRRWCNEDVPHSRPA